MIAAIILTALVLALFELAHVTHARPVTRASAILAGISAMAMLAAVLTSDTWLAGVALPWLLGALALLLVLLLHAPGAPLRTRNTLSGGRSSDQ